VVGLACFTVVACSSGTQEGAPPDAASPTDPAPSPDEGSPTETDADVDVDAGVARDAGDAGTDAATTKKDAGPPPFTPHDCDTSGSKDLVYFASAAEDPRGPCPCLQGECCYRKYPGPVCVME